MRPGAAALRPEERRLLARLAAVGTGVALGAVCSLTTGWAALAVLEGSPQ